MITPVRIPETPVILHRPQPGQEEDSVSVDTAKTQSEKQKKSPSPSGLSSKTNPSGREAVGSLSQGSDLEEVEQELEQLEEVEKDGVVSSVKDVPVATLVSTA